MVNFKWMPIGIAAGLALTLSGCGGSDDTQANALSVDQQGRARAVALAAGSYPVVCSGPRGTSERVTLTIGSDGRVALPGRESVDVTSPDVTFQIGTSGDVPQFGGRHLQWTIRPAMATQPRPTTYVVVFDTPDASAYAFREVHYLDRGQASAWTECKPAEARPGPRIAPQSLFPTLLPVVAASMTCTSAESSGTTRQQVELTPSELTFTNESEVARVSLTQPRRHEDIRYFEQAPPFLPDNTGLWQHALMADDRFFTLAWDRQGALTEATVGTGINGLTSLRCRI